ncbi:hypothetical protein D3C86_1541470 [compost metagenome]
MLSPPIAMQAAGDGGLVRLDASVAQRCELFGVTFAMNDRPQNLQARHPGDIADHLGQLDVHLAQGFLQAINRLGLIADFIGPLTNQRTH